MCRGNHDRFGEQDPKQLAFLQDAGIRVLSEESVSLPLFTLYGRSDLKKPRRSAEDLAKIPARPLIVLDHNPKEAPLLLEEGVSLVLCGHTHNGQTFPGNLISRIESKFNYGLHRVNNGYALTTAGAENRGNLRKFNKKVHVHEFFTSMCYSEFCRKTL